MSALSVNYDYRTRKPFDQVFLATLFVSATAGACQAQYWPRQYDGATAAVSVLVFAGSDAGQDQNCAVIALPKAKHRQRPSFGR
jgi:hypothetical protein